VTTFICGGRWRAAYQTLLTIKLIRAENSYQKALKGGKIELELLNETFDGPRTSKEEMPGELHFAKQAGKEQWLSQVLLLLSDFLVQDFAAGGPVVNKDNYSKGGSNSCSTPRGTTPRNNSL